ncbi:Methyl-accepting chemotaxis protein [Marinobacter sp. LV10R510-11A]|uniref:methyl-accepting chemotaxis protein n=1 Tax=Marinobacter sp. LV10R510-11A TaxID=1415568 RepID=UPI000BC06BC4|nr:methyl-accepting chemotaxis protein [Marinobacter sp. LV10R510-11A]SOB78011.1 Methyl-accepting chemotaxis protein [Marinobacter sp. LV10R510-11A]
MKNIINNLSMRGKLITLVVPTLLIIVYFAAESVALNTGELGDMRELRSLVQLADIGDPLIKTLQKERGRSAVVLSSGSDRDAARQAEQALTMQRRQTDTQLPEYHARITNLTQETTFGPAVTNSIQSVEQGLAILDRLRSSVDKGSINGSEAGIRYTQLITGLLSRIPLVISRSTDPELTRNINAYYALAEAAEAAGKERAAGAALISGGNFDLPAIQKIATFEGHQEAFIREAGAMLTSDSTLLAVLKNLPVTNESRDLQEKRNTLFSSPSGMYALDAVEWFDITTERLGNLNDLRKTLLESTSTAATQGVAKARHDLFVVSGIATAAIIAVFALMLLMVSAINQQINSLLDGVRFAMDNKDLTQQIHISSKDEVGTIGRAINELFGRFGSALQHIDRASVQLATATEETSSTACQNATQTKSQQEQIEQVAAATEEMSATSEQISRNTQQVADAANTVMVRSRAGEEVLQGSVRRIHSLASSVKDVNDVIEELEKRSGSIVEVMDVIRKVADQTNLLALNAAIEAARAGEHGRGFAVVADEVRTLARQTHDSTTQIEDIINGFQVITENASRSIVASHELANEASEQSSELEQTFAAILGDVNSISDMATQIAAASEQQVAVTRELAGNMEAVSEVAILTLTGSQEISHVTGEQARLARQLQDLANEFKVSAA